MKALSFLALFVSVVSASSETTCEDCVAVVTTISSFLTTPESIDRQTEILLAEICPIDPVPEDCFEQLPGSTGMHTRGMTCADCDYLIWGFLDQLVREDIVTGITETLAGDLFCGLQDNPEACSHIIHELIPYALPILVNAEDAEQRPQICNTAMPYTCPTL